MRSPLQITSVISVLRKGGKFLLVQRNLKDSIFPGKWQNVGGKVELGERVEEAIKREVKEEVGLEINAKPIFLMSYSWRKDDSEPFRLGLIFLINLTKPLIKYKVKINEELGNYGWFEYKEIKAMNRKGLLIGKNSSRGTLAQTKGAVKFLSLRPRSGN